MWRTYTVSPARFCLGFLTGKSAPDLVPLRSQGGQGPLNRGAAQAPIFKCPAHMSSKPGATSESSCYCDPGELAVETAMASYLLVFVQAQLGHTMVGGNCLQRGVIVTIGLTCSCATKYKAICSFGFSSFQCSADRQCTCNCLHVHCFLQGTAASSVTSVQRAAGVLVKTGWNVSGIA